MTKLVALRYKKVFVAKSAALSRNKVTSGNKIGPSNVLDPMKKLNKRKIKWIVRQIDERNYGVWRIARIQKITKQHAYTVYKRFKGVKDPMLLPCGRKPRPISSEETKLVVDTYKEFRVGATMIEQILDEKGIHVPHNRIHKVLLSQGLAKNEPKKQRRRKWVRYERKHSNSLWHADWFVIFGKNVFLTVDDASRLCTAHGEFGRATTNNSILACNKGTKKWGKPKQFITDHGTQFVANEQEAKKKGQSQFTSYLKKLGIQHLKARIKHPQSNGKVERLKQTMHKLWKELGSLDKAVKHYNYKRPHRSLTNGKLRTPHQAFIDKKRKS